MVSGYLLSIPVAGTWLHWMLFGGRASLAPRSSPGSMPRTCCSWWSSSRCSRCRAALLARHRHPQYPGRGRSEGTVVCACGCCPTTRYPLRGAVRPHPGRAGRDGGLFQVNPVWTYGPANPAHVSGGTTSPWYFGWVDGAVRLWPAWDIHLGDHTIPAGFWPSMVFLPLSFVALALYPAMESRFSRDTAHHHLLQRPRDLPAHTSLGVLVVTFYGCLQLAAAIDILAFTFHLSSDALLWAARIGVFLLPGTRYEVTYRSASTWSTRTAQCWSTASRPASSNDSRTVRMSRCTDPSPDSTKTASRSGSRTGISGSRSDDRSPGPAPDEQGPVVVRWIVPAAASP